MPAEPRLSVLMPVFKEGAAVVPVVRALAGAIKVPYELIVVYDFDEDPTVPFLVEMAASLPQLRPWRNDLGRGALNALKSGFAAARGQYVLITMADGSDDMASLPAMLEAAAAGASVVAASRYMKGGSQHGAPFAKSLMSRFAGLSLHAIGALPIHDPTNNFKLYARDFLQSVDIESRGGFELALELTVKAHLAGLVLVEVPTTWQERSLGQSNFKVWAWLPQYLRWYRMAIVGRLKSGLARPASR